MVRLASFAGSPLHYPFKNTTGITFTAKLSIIISLCKYIEWLLMTGNKIRTSELVEDHRKKRRRADHSDDDRNPFI